MTALCFFFCGGGGEVDLIICEIMIYSIIVKNINVLILNFINNNSSVIDNRGSIKIAYF